MTGTLESARVSREGPKLLSGRHLMPRFGRYGPCLKAFHPRKSLRGLLRKRRQAGSIPAVKHGLMTAGESATPNSTKRPRTCPRSKCGPDIQLSFLLFRVNRVPVILISFRNRFLAFTPTIT